MTGLSGAILRPSAAIGKPGPSLMPLIMDGADYDRWLSAEVPPIDLRPYPAEKMTAYEIGRQINRRGYDAPDIVDPAPRRDEGSAAPELPL